jgi:hypothetical protein
MWERQVEFFFRSGKVSNGSGGGDTEVGKKKRFNQY